MILRSVPVVIYIFIIYKIDAREAGLLQEEKTSISEIRQYDEAYSNRQDNTSTVIGDFAAHAAVQHPEPKPHFGHLGHWFVRLGQDNAGCQLF